MFLLRGRLFSLSRRDLAFVFAMHMLRIGVSLGLVALLWHMLLPPLPVRWLFVLATLRMMLSRLPFLPAKDVIFAGLVAVLLGAGAAIVPVITLIASLVVAAHVAVGLCSAVADFVLELRTG